MRLTATLFVLATSFVAHSAAQATSSSGIFTIQPITSIIPSSLISTPPPLTEATRTSTRIGGSQVQPTSFTTSRRTVSDASTDRPPPSSSTATAPSASDATSTITTSLSVLTSSAVASASSVAASATSSAAPNAAAKPLVGASAGVFGVLAALGGALLV